jgi:catechol 2,3-dioxygenase-like lactoylglutathione lyase family enzyme
MTTIHRPAFHHVNLKTTQLQAMIDWYCTVVGARVMYQYEMGAWLSNDDANHRIALLAFPNFTEEGKLDEHIGMHHSAFEYASFEEMNDSYLRLKALGIVPELCLDHGLLRRSGPQPRRATGRLLRRLGEVLGLHQQLRRLSQRPARPTGRP